MGLEPITHLSMRHMFSKHAPDPAGYLPDF
jgi:hypothetical protein